MENQNREQHAGPTFHDLYPTLTEVKLKEAEAHFRRYLLIASEVLQEQQSAGGDFDLSSDLITMKERSNVLKS